MVEYLLELSNQLVLKATGRSQEQQVNLRNMMRRKTERLSDMLGWLGVTSRNSYVCEPVLAFTIFLFRMATTTQWYECELKFGMYSPIMSEIYWEIVELINEKCGSLLNLRRGFIQQRCETLRKRHKRCSAPLHDCVGFIDSTKIRMARPGGEDRIQNACYSGHKRCRHDLTFLRNSNWNAQLENCLTTVERQYYIYGDSTYQLRPWMQRPFHDNCTDAQKAFNAEMSSCVFGTTELKGSKAAMDKPGFCL
eukprot:IDg6166t1